MISCIQELSEHEFEYSGEVLSKIWKGIKSAYVDLKECESMKERNDILKWVSNVILGLENAEKVSSSDFSFVESTGRWGVVNLDLIKKHLKA